MKNPPTQPASFHRKSTTLVALGLALSLFDTGCTSLQTVALPQMAPEAVATTVAVHVGDAVEIRAKSGQVYKLRITAVESDALVAGKLRVKYDDMAVLKVERPDRRKTVTTAIVVGAIVTAAIVVGLVVVLTHIGPGMTGG